MDSSGDQTLAESDSKIEKLMSKSNEDEIPSPATKVVNDTDLDKQSPIPIDDEIPVPVAAPDENTHEDEIPSPSEIVETTSQTESNGLDTDRSSILSGRMIKDRFGFIITESDTSHQRLSLTAKEIQQRKNKESERAGKWITMMRKWTSFDHSSKLKSRVRKGIPDALRSFAWKQLAENDKIRAKYPVPPVDIDTSTLSSLVKDEVTTSPFSYNHNCVLIYLFTFIIVRID